LAAVVNSARLKKENLDMYVTDILLSNAKDRLPALIESVRSAYVEINLALVRPNCSNPSFVFSPEIRQFVKSLPPVNRERMKALEKKLDKCRNEENDPDSPK
jgi:cyclin H